MLVFGGDGDCLGQSLTTAIDTISSAIIIDLVDSTLKDLLLVGA